MYQSYAPAITVTSWPFLALPITLELTVESERILIPSSLTMPIKGKFSSAARGPKNNNIRIIAAGIL